MLSYVKRNGKNDLSGCQKYSKMETKHKKDKRTFQTKVVKNSRELGMEKEKTDYEERPLEASGCWENRPKWPVKRQKEGEQTETLLEIVYLM